jgi:hypothetical protein
MTDENSSKDRSGSRTGTYESAVFELTPKDKYILEYNHADCSLREISKLLKLEHDIDLKPTAIHRRLKELRQDPDNNVKTRECTIPQKPREETRWYKIMKRLQEAIPEYVRLHGFKPSSRTMFYQMQDEGLVSKNKKDHTTFVEKTREARLGWVDSDGNLLWPELDMECFSDDDSRKTVGEYDDYSPSDPTDPGPIPDPNGCINLFISRVKSAIRYFEGKGEEGDAGRIGGRWYGQPEYVEVWEEKVDLLVGFEKILHDKGIKVRANKGFPSLIFLNKCCKELKEVTDDFEPEQIHILYAGDWDPSGETMVYYIQKRLRQLGIEGVDVKRIAVTPEQIDEYNLPLMSLESKKDKGEDPNLREFMRRYGDKATHLNAFFTKKHIKDFERILIDSVDEYWDESIYDEMVDEYEDAKPEEPESMDEDQLNDAKKTMCKKVSEEFYPGWGADGGYYEEDEDEDFDEDDTDDEEQPTDNDE